MVGDGWPRSWFLNAVFLVFVAAMMVSRVPTFSIKRIRIAPEQVLPTLLVASVVIVGLVVETWLTLSLIGLLYLLQPPGQRGRRRGACASARPRRRRRCHPSERFRRARGEPGPAPAATLLTGRATTSLALVACSTRDCGG